LAEIAPLGKRDVLNLVPALSQKDDKPVWASPAPQADIACGTLITNIASDAVHLTATIL
jgi:hypothetical protein